MTNRIDIPACIKCAERELRMRETVYPRRVTDGKMRRETADAEIAAQRDIITLLSWLSRNAVTVRRVAAMSEHQYQKAVAEAPAVRAVQAAFPDAELVNPDAIEVDA